MQQVINGAVLASIYVLFSLGLTLSWGTLNVLNLAHGAVFMFAGFTAYLVTKNIELPLAALIPICIVVAGLITVILELLAFREIRRRAGDLRQAELLMLIASVGAATIPVTIAQNETHDTPFGLGHVSYRTIVYHTGSVSISNTQIMIICFGLALSIALGVWVKFSRQGRAIRALAYDPETSRLMGISSGRLAMATMFVAGGLAGLASILLMVYLGSLTPESGDNLLIKGFAAIILGGIGSVWGTLAGAIVLAAGETLVLTYTSGSWADAVSFGIIIVVILLRPQGLVAPQKTERV
jgi:branched-chain amino acid transport system permease protein